MDLEDVGWMWTAFIGLWTWIPWWWGIFWVAEPLLGSEKKESGEWSWLSFLFLRYFLNMRQMGCHLWFLIGRREMRHQAWSVCWQEVCIQTELWWGQAVWHSGVTLGRWEGYLHNCHRYNILYPKIVPVYSLVSYIDRITCIMYIWLKLIYMCESECFELRRRTDFLISIQTSVFQSQTFMIFL